MACTEKQMDLMHKVLDNEAAEEEKQALYDHLRTCENCRRQFNELKKSVQLLRRLPRHELPLGFTQSVMMQLPPEKTHSIKRWMGHHPLLVAAAIFLVMMSGYLFSAWSNPAFQATVDGQGHVTTQGHTVIVPKHEVIKGDLIVQNGAVKIDGRVKGNVVLINSQSLQASAGHVTGDIEQVNQIVSWIWYEIRHFFVNIFR